MKLQQSEIAVGSGTAQNGREKRADRQGLKLPSVVKELCWKTVGVRYNKREKINDQETGQ